MGQSTTGCGYLLAAIVLSWALVLAPVNGASETTPPGLKSYPGRYYTIYTDLDANAAREAEARMTAMAEEYHRRTRGFAGAIRKRLPFYLFRKAEDYYQAGGTPGSAGIYHPKKEVLMALADTGTDDQLWHVIQHEGFHQFVDKVVGGRIPIWVNEGLAEYFGQGVWTGDGFVTGVIPPHRLKALQAYIRAGELLPFAKMISITRKQWSNALGQASRPRSPADADARANDPNAKANRAQIHYDQAWSMVHFLVHAANGRYRKAFSAMISDISRGRTPGAAFRTRLGRNVQAFEKRYKDWWLAQPENPTAGLYIQAVVQTLTSFLARAVSQGQTFADPEDFFRQARRGRLKSHSDQWLPGSLLDRTLLYARPWKRGWRLDAAETLPRLVLAWPNGKTYTGTFTHRGGKAYGVRVTVTGRK